MGRAARLCLAAGVLGLLLCVAPPLAGVEAAGALEGEQGVRWADGLPQPLAQELGWGSQMLLTATPAASLLLYWRGRTVLRRGVLADAAFIPGAICARAWSTGKAIGLVNLKLYPGRQEFVGLPEGIPALIVQPIGTEGVILLAGWSPRCFSRSDEAWLEGWSLKLRTALELCDAAPEVPMSPSPAG